MTDLARGHAFLPLKQAFCQVWEEWLLMAPALLSSAEPPETLLMRVVEETSILARRVYRTVVLQSGAANAAHAQLMQYAFVALLDEVLLFTPWSGQADWQATPLEYRLFGSRTAGETLPERMDALIARPDPSERDLAAVYLMALVLGFRGRLRLSPAQYEHCCKSLFEQVWQREADVHQLGRVLAGNSVVAPLQLNERKMLPDAFRMAVLLCFLFALMLGVSHLFWRDISQRVDLSHAPLSGVKP